MGNIETFYSFILNNTLQFYILKFLHFSAAGAYLVMMIFVVVCPLVKREVPPELVLENQLTFYQQLHGVVQGSTADAEVPLSHRII